MAGGCDLQEVTSRGRQSGKGLVAGTPRYLADLLAVNQTLIFLLLLFILLLFLTVDGKTLVSWLWSRD